MGNCWPKPVESLPASATTRPPCPVHNKDAKANKSRNGGKPSPANDQEEEVPPTGRIITPNLKIFTLAELKSATRNFRPDTVLGEGGFGRVFKGYIDEKTYAPSKVGVGMPVAVKKSNPESEQGPKEWQAELKFLGKFSHPNLVKLLGYCSDERQLLLVYEYMQRGSLESHLFRKGGAGDPLPWDTRIKIAIGAARGLAFLHNTEKQVIYRDFKASNILLDREFNAKLSDFGFAKLGPIDGHSHVTTNPVGTYGYAAPEYMATGHLYVKSDVYGFGIVLLEIITGLRVLDNNRPVGQTNLVNWAMPSLNNKKRLNKVIDQRLMGHYPSTAMYATSEVILECLKADPKYRPSMDEVLSKLVEISCIQMKPNESQAQYQQRSRGHRRHSQDGIGGARGKGAVHPHQKNLKATHTG